MQADLYYVMKKLIRLHYRDDENKTRELLTMITKALHPDTMTKLTTIEQMTIEISEKDETISKQDETISKQDETILKQDKALSEKDETISQQSDEIRRLKKKLEENHIEDD